MKLGERVKQRRLDMNLSQQSLAKGIATQSQISKIEKNELQPGSQLLFNISRRLNCSMDFLYKGDELDSQLEQKLIVIERLLEDRDYEALIPIIDGKYLSNGSTDERAASKWIRSIIAFYKYEDFEQAILLIEEAMNLIDNEMNVKLQLSICNTRAIFYYRQNENSTAKASLTKGLQIAKRNNIENHYMIKLLYTLSNIYASELAFDRCLQYAQSAFDVTIKSYKYMLYSELVYNIVQSRLQLGIHDGTDIKQLEIALYLSDLSKKHSISILIRDLMKKLDH
ncbi:helix-turn-helix domain-containing protein [Mammaliicoccus stepanovicii]|uniref:Putative DNA binding protein n=1 Tax=Mammaliicoccus stepanovicii TaxID=643214 RepID=A0A239YGC5_9STAP|nr:helix-turn-helix domain-containing protein [Mammaliicoccus stepanovicii]PNZ74696.1 helix-turn-helix domain-containing protein [Mammaliicoccus stepanovicii]GGI40833.1 transcriptional regulator [Mammaliicoccus stepanovicii]SNV58189.1 putative DNA binding protein [Mammaliicoccus stepanovicii]